MRARIFCLSLLALLVAVSPALAAPQTTTPSVKVRATIDQIKDIVAREKKTLGKEELNQKLEGILRLAFDFDEMSRRCLGPNWKEANKEQQTEFVDLFSSLLSRTYLNRIVDGIETSEIRYEGEKVKGKKAIVKTKVTDDGQWASIDYRMRLGGSDWRVYDVIIENVGLVSNYRSEFSGIIRKDQISGLLQQLREKQ